MSFSIAAFADGSAGVVSDWSAVGGSVFCSAAGIVLAFEVDSGATGADVSLRSMSAGNGAAPAAIQFRRVAI